MERTIDGIDYIAKSEVLRLLTESIDRAERYATSDTMSKASRAKWEYTSMELKELRYRLVGPEEV